MTPALVSIRCMTRTFILGGLALTFIAFAIIAVLRSKSGSDRSRRVSDNWNIVVELPKTNSAKAAQPAGTKVEFHR